MHPVLIDIGPITIYSYGFFVATAILLALGIAYREAKQQGLPHRIVPDLGFYLILSAIVGARILYVLLRLEYFLDHPLEILQFWKGGLVFSGGAVLAIAVGWLYLRRQGQSFAAWADAFAPGIAAGQAWGRIGCFMAGCCYGKVCYLPWAVSFESPGTLAPTHVPLHPTQIYHSVAGVITFVLLMTLGKRLQRKGQTFALFLVLYGLFRISIEFYRASHSEVLLGMSVTQWLSAGLLLAGAVILFRPRSAPHG
jgi:phosphatidylglycerol:prolipoprotein diacylglycerol transferase